MSNALFLTNQRAELTSSRHINWYLQVIKTNSVPGCYQVERGLSVDHFKLPRDSSTSSPDEAAWHCLAMLFLQLSRTHLNVASRRGQHFISHTILISFAPLWKRWEQTSPQHHHHHRQPADAHSHQPANQTDNIWWCRTAMFVIKAKSLMPWLSKILV